MTREFFIAIDPITTLHMGLCNSPSTLRRAKALAVAVQKYHDNFLDDEENVKEYEAIHYTEVNPTHKVLHRRSLSPPRTVNNNIFNSNINVNNSNHSGSSGGSGGAGGFVSGMVGGGFSPKSYNRVAVTPEPEVARAAHVPSDGGVMPFESNNSVSELETKPKPKFHVNPHQQYETTTVVDGEVLSTVPIKIDPASFVLEEVAQQKSLAEGGAKDEEEGEEECGNFDTAGSNQQQNRSPTAAATTGSNSTANAAKINNALPSLQAVFLSGNSSLLASNSSNGSGSCMSSADCENVYNILRRQGCRDTEHFLRLLRWQLCNNNSNGSHSVNHQNGTHGASLHYNHNNYVGAVDVSKCLAVCMQLGIPAFHAMEVVEYFRAYI